MYSFFLIRFENRNRSVLIPSFKFQKLNYHQHQVAAFPSVFLWSCLFEFENRVLLVKPLLLEERRYFIRFTGSNFSCDQWIQVINISLFFEHNEGPVLIFTNWHKNGFGIKVQVLNKQIKINSTLLYFLHSANIKNFTRFEIS